MTKYILHGGGAGKKTENNKKFFVEIANSLPPVANILLSCHAKTRDRWGESLDAMNEMFLSIAPEKKFNIELASEDAGFFVEQLKKADALYMAGGNTHFLWDFFSRISDIESLFANKTIIGSSAGALILSKYFYENDDDSFGKGLGILPFKVFCHYSADQLGKMKHLQEFEEEIEIKAIPEEQFIVFEK